MARHKITAIKVTKKGDDLILTAMTQSPRGTSVMLEREVVSGRKEAREALNTKVALALGKLLPSEVA